MGFSTTAPSLRRWKRQFGRASMVLFLLAALFAYLAGVRVSDIAQGYLLYLYAFYLVLAFGVFIMILGSADRYEHVPRSRLKL